MKERVYLTKEDKNILLKAQKILLKRLKYPYLSIKCLIGFPK